MILMLGVRERAVTHNAFGRNWGYGKMISRWFAPVLVLLCLGLTFPAWAARRTFDAHEKELEEQKDDNKRWEREAKARETELMKIADEYYKEKNYRKAEDYYRKLLDIRYEQWEFREFDVGGRRSIRPARDKKTLKLDTSTTRRAEERLRTIDEKVATQDEAEAKKELQELSEKAEVAMMLGKADEAYMAYERLIATAGRLGEEKYAVAAALTAKSQQKAIVDGAAKSLGEIEKLVKEGKVAEAADKLAECLATHNALMRAAPELAVRFRQINESPEFLQHDRELQAARRIELGDASFERTKYLGAYKHYRAVTVMFPETEAARLAEERLAKLLEDKTISAALKQQEIDAACQPLMIRARALVKVERVREAQAICRQIIEEHPDTTWAEQASELLRESAETRDVERAPEE